MKIRFYGHASFAVKVGGKRIIVDPFITGNPLTKDFAVEGLRADYIFLTHAHQDHILDAEEIARNTGAIIVSNYEIVSHYISKGLNGHHLNHGGTLKTPEFSAKYVRAVHTSSFPDGSYGGEPGGFVIQGDGKSIYIAGDTALTTDMKLIPMYTKLDLAILPIGDTFTMGYEDAVIASTFLECDRIVGCHYNTFPPIEIDTNKAIEVFEKENKELILLNIGEKISV